MKSQIQSKNNGGSVSLWNYYTNIKQDYQVPIASHFRIINNRHKIISIHVAPL